MNAGNISIDLELNGDKFTVQVKNTAGILRELRRDLETTASGVDHIGRKFNSFGGNLIYLVHQVQAVRYAFIDFRDVFLTLPASILKTSGEIERLTKVMEGLSTAKDKALDAKESQKYLMDFAQRAPFEITALKDTFIKLKTGGIDPMNGSMQGLVDSVAKFGGSSEQLKRAAVAIQQMGGKGVISMEELRQQLGEAIPNAMNIMAVASGKTLQKFTQEVSKGTVESKSHLERMFIGMQLNSNGAAAAMMETWVGLTERMKTRWQIFQNEIGGGDSQYGAFTAAKRELSGLLDLLDSPNVRQFGSDVESVMYKGVQAVGSLVSTIVNFYGEIKTAGEIMLYYFAGTKFSDALKGIGSAMNDVRQTYRQSVSEYVVAQEEQAQVARSAAQTKILMIESEIEERRRLIQVEMEQAAQFQLAEQRARESMAMTALSIQQMERRWGAAGAAHIAAARADIAAAKQVEVAARAEGLAHMDNIRAIEAEIAALNADAVAKARNTVATEATTVAQRAMAGATGLARGALALLGGPIGAITMALMAGVWAWQEWGNAAEKSAEVARRAANKMSEVGDMAAIEAEIRKKQADIERDSELAKNDKNWIPRLEEEKRQLEELQKRRLDIKENLEKRAVDDYVAATKRTAEREVAERTKVEREKLDAINSEMTKIGQKYSDPSSSLFIKDDGARNAKINSELSAFISAQKEAGLKERAAVIGEYRKRVSDLEAQMVGLKEDNPQFKQLKGAKEALEGEIAKAINFSVDLATKYGTPGVSTKGKNDPTLKNGLLNKVNQVEDDFKIVLAKFRKLSADARDFSQYRDVAIAEARKAFDAGQFDADIIDNGKKKKAPRGNFDDRVETDPLIQKFINKTAALAEAKDILSGYTKLSSEILKNESEADQILSLLNKGDYDSPNTKSNAASVRIQSLLNNLDALGNEAGLTKREVDDLGNALSTALGATKRAEAAAAAADIMKSLRSMGAETEKMKREVAVAGMLPSQQLAGRHNEELALLNKREAQEIELVGDSESRKEAIRKEFAERRAVLEQKFALDGRTQLQLLGIQWGDITYQMNQATANWANKFMDSMTEMVMTGKGSWQKLLQSIATDMVRMNLQKTFGDVVTGVSDAIGTVTKKAMTGSGDIGGIFDKVVGGLKGFWDSITGATDATAKNAAATGESVARAGQELIGMSTKMTAEQAATASLIALANAAYQAAGVLGGGSGAGAGGLAGIAGMAGFGGLFKSSGGVETDSWGSGFGSGVGVVEGMEWFENGGIMTEFGSVPLRKYANGGIANSPQLAIYGEGKMPEAYVPLPDGRSIPVSMDMSGMPATGGGAMVVNVNVIEGPGTTATVKKTQNSDGTMSIDVMVEQLDSMIAQKISRGRSDIGQTIERTYGLNKAAGAHR